FDGPPLAFGQIPFPQSGEESDDILRRIAMRQILDLRPITGRVRHDVVLDRHREIDQLTGHGLLPFIPANGCAPRTIAPGIRGSSLPTSHLLPSSALRCRPRGRRCAAIPAADRASGGNAPPLIARRWPALRRSRNAGPPARGAAQSTPGA